MAFPKPKIWKISLPTLLMFWAGFLFGQNNEMVQTWLKKVQEASFYDSARLFSTGIEAEKKLTEAGQQNFICEIHLYYGNYFFYVRNLDKAKKYFEQALKESTVRGNMHINVLARVRLAYIEFDNGKTDKALKDMNNLMAEARKGNDYRNIAELLNILGIILEQKNEKQEAVKLYLEGINLSEKHNLPYYNGVFHNNLGLIKYYSGQSDEALKDYEAGLVQARKDNNPRLASHILMNMCVVYVNQKNFEKASGLFREVTDYSRNNNLPLELASVYINLASSFEQAGRPETALQYLDSGIYVLKKHNLLNELARAYLGKTDALIYMGRIKEAEKVLEEVKALTLITKSLEDISNYYLFRYRIHASRNDTKNALENYLQHVRFKDSLNNLINARAIEELQVKYDVQNKEIELEKEQLRSLELEKSNQEERFMKRLIALTGGGLIVLSVLFFIIWYSRKMREKQEQFSQMLIKDIEAERHRIARDLHDDIGQSLSILKSNVEQNQGGKDLAGELSRVIEQTRQLSRNLYPAYLEKIGLVRACAAMAEKVQASTGIECSCEIDENIENTNTETKTHLYRILQECVNNTIKHSGANALKFSITKAGNDFTLNYRDNGKGIGSSKKSAGVGLQSILERSRIINGFITWGDKNEKGFSLTLKFNPTV